MNEEQVYVWANSKRWQDWINKQEITLGQPMLKNDKSCQLLDIKARCKFVTIAHPKLRGFDTTKRRYFIPKDLEQVIQFYIEVYKADNVKVEFIVNERINVEITKANQSRLVPGFTWQEAATKLLKVLWEK